MKFIEIEHKYLVDEAFDRVSFHDQVLALQPARQYRVQVKDTYYQLQGNDDFLYRYTEDEQLQKLTVKSLGGDPECRQEVCLNLCIEQGSQREAVQAFLGMQPLTVCGSLQKDVQVYLFDDCEIVYYLASSQQRQVACVEFEALKALTKDGALATIKSYETKLNFLEKNRCRKSLFELMSSALDV